MRKIVGKTVKWKYRGTNGIRTKVAEWPPESARTKNKRTINGADLVAIHHFFSFVAVAVVAVVVLLCVARARVE